MSSCRATLNDSDFTTYYQKVALHVSGQVASTVIHGDTSERATYHGQPGEVTRLHAADVPQDLLVLLRTHIVTNVSYLSFLSLREMSLHSAAASPMRVLITSISLMGYFATLLDARGLRILGPWCAILTTEPHSNVLLLCNWKTGALCKLNKVAAGEARQSANSGSHHSTSTTSPFTGSCTAVSTYKGYDTNVGVQGLTDMEIFWRSAEHIEGPQGAKGRNGRDLHLQLCHSNGSAYRVQLGHPIGEECLLPQRAFNDDFTLIHTNGIHEIGLDYCGCDTAHTHTTQLLRVAWFPATTSKPRTAATFQILEQYHLLSFESKASGYEFYHAIARLTDNTGLHPHKPLNPSIESGRGHDPAGAGKNLPDDWQDAPDDKRWLYSLFVAIDANFRLKRRAISKDGTDPGLSQGWAYFVEETAYKSHLQQYSGKPQEKSTCSSHNAVNMADTKASQGLAATGVGTIDCARHNMKLPNGVGDLQKGERYTNMDYLFFSALSQRRVNVLNISYDIACQWHKHIWQRMSTMPAHLRLDHAITCSLLQFFQKRGRTDGEAPERGWSNKSRGVDAHERDQGLEGTPWTTISRLELEEISWPRRRPPQDGENVELWEENPNDVSVPNPFEMKVSTITQAAVRLKLVEIEAHQLREGNDMSLHIDVSPSVFIATGIDLESEQ
ncbi:hypothetical protein EV424DRAFT_1543991 [Suillus variegatus]|nr:hypothetical protein EV424DRAFT_1543991 [Suillus variegatus]